MNKKGYVSAMEHRQDETADDQLGRVATLVAQARKAGLEDMTACFLAVHEFSQSLNIIGHDDVVKLGRDLLVRLTEGEDIDRNVVYTAMNRNSQLHNDVNNVPFERFQDHLPTLVRLVAPGGYMPYSNFREYRRRALERLEELHRSGTRLSYGVIDKIVGGTNTWSSPKSTSPAYFRRLQELVGKRRARRRLNHAWTHYCKVATPVHNQQSFERVKSFIMWSWFIWAKRPFKEACNLIFEDLAQNQRPFPKTYVKRH